MHSDTLHQYQRSLVQKGLIEEDPMTGLPNWNSRTGLCQLKCSRIQQPVPLFDSTSPVLLSCGIAGLPIWTKRYFWLPSPPPLSVYAVRDSGAASHSASDN